jgi:pantoate--beta-alanine ligase
VIKIFTKSADLQAFSKNTKKHNLRVGFVPTMGALHEGHLSLIKESRRKCDVTVCSIFVNPTQFSNPDDLKNYPRMPDQDLALLEGAGCDVAFVPEVNEVYHNEIRYTFDFNGIDNLLEGKSRPGHFEGVARVLSQLFRIVEPDFAFFGEKDYQQVLIVRKLVEQLRLPLTVVSHPIVRESDFLAMSSRNKLLNKKERAVAAAVPRILQAAARKVAGNQITEAKKFAESEISRIHGARLDYLEISDPQTLRPLKEVVPGQAFVVLIAVYVGQVRLIDNILSDVKGHLPEWADKLELSVSAN